MKARIRPIYFYPGKDEEFDIQLERLRDRFHSLSEFLDPVPLESGSFDRDQQENVEAVVFPQLLGEAYRQIDAFRRINLPILIITSEFGTLSMWDWEICSYLKSEGIRTIAPYNAEQVEILLQALAAKRQLSQGKFVVYQDNPGEGYQPSIFKRFYWWEEECVSRIRDIYGVEVIRTSFKDLGKRAREISNSRVTESIQRYPVPVVGVGEKGILDAYKLYLAIVEDLDRMGGVLACGINCLNESHFCNTTPCLAWNLLFEQRSLIWGCEADLLSMLTKYLIHAILKVPVMMTNVYPFLLGEAALKHEKIPQFPTVEEPENHVLLAHCGYMGVIPASFATEWTLRPKVLDIVNDNSVAIDARLPTGKVTLAKIDSTGRMMRLSSANLKGYAQYPGSHCLNGGVLEVPDGRALIRNLDSHHSILVGGDYLEEIELVSMVMSFETGRMTD